MRLQIACNAGLARLANSIWLREVIIPLIYLLLMRDFNGCNCSIKEAVSHTKLVGEKLAKAVKRG